MGSLQGALPHLLENRGYRIVYFNGSDSLPYSQDQLLIAFLRCVVCGKACIHSLSAARFSFTYVLDCSLLWSQNVAFTPLNGIKAGTQVDKNLTRL